MMTERLWCMGVKKGRRRRRRRRRVRTKAPLVRRIHYAVPFKVHDAAE